MDGMRIKYLFESLKGGSRRRWEDNIRMDIRKQGGRCGLGPYVSGSRLL
jgi:hypothetical protein